MKKEFNYSPKEIRSSGASPPEDKEPKVNPHNIRAKEVLQASGSEFNLSDHVEQMYEEKFIRDDHVKEFIKELKFELIIDHKFTIKETAGHGIRNIIKLIDKLAGKELI